MRGHSVEEDPLRAFEEVDLLRRRVLNVVGHEFRTPVSTLRGLADQLARTSDPAMRADLNAALQRSAERVERLLDDLLLAAGITTALPVGEPEPVPVIPTAVAVWDGLGSPRELQVEGDPEATVCVRPGVLDRLLQHLMDNAVKYGNGAVTLRAEQVGDEVVVELESAGDPMSGADLRLAFELFYRGERAVTSSPGLGVGLPVARALARQHGGDLVMAGDDGEVVVRLSLPLQ